MHIVTAAQMQALDRRTIEEAHIPGLHLMEQAGIAAVDAAEAAFGPFKGKRVLVVCGKGHNGGDGLVVARLLVRKRADVRVVLVHPLSALSPDTRTMYRRLTKVGSTRHIRQSPSPEQMAQECARAELLVDALLGTGIASPVSGLYRSMIDAMNASGRPIVAIDLPSGLNADTGACMGTAIRAALTVTFGLPKYGLFLGEGIEHAGAVAVVDIGIPEEYAEAVDSPVRLLTPGPIARSIPPRHRTAHKGTFGHIGVIAGSPGKTGAAALAARAALRVGSGLVTVATPAGVNPILEGKLLEAMSLPIPDTPVQVFGPASLDALLAFAQGKTSLAIGPGIGTHEETVSTIRQLLPQITVPCVVDADALNAIADCPSLWKQCQAPLLLTPHPGEMARLAGLANGQAVNQDRLGVARDFAHRHGVIVVLKGARTVLADPDGRTALCPTGNPGLATGGTGDVLTGMIGGLLAQGLDPWNAACTGTYLHGLAGDLAATARGPVSLIAGDVIDHISHAITQIER